MAGEVTVAKGVTNNPANALSGGRRARQVEILQIQGRDEQSRNAKFMSSRQMRKYGIDFNPSLYSTVYSGEMNVGSLDDVYSQLQGRKPDGYSGHSLSVSDLIRTGGKTYFVDDYGFKKVK